MVVLTADGVVVSLPVVDLFEGGVLYGCVSESVVLFLRLFLALRL